MKVEWDVQYVPNAWQRVQFSDSNLIVVDGIMLECQMRQSTKYFAVLCHRQKPTDEAHILIKTQNTEQCYLMPEMLGVVY